MTEMETQVVAYDDAVHREQVTRLWERVFAYKAARNSPALVIDKKLAVSDGLFFVALSGETVVGSIMAGYDGRRGWLYMLAVDRKNQRKGIGSKMLKHVEGRLAALGCVKINLQITDDNELVTEFYEDNGYSIEPRICMGKTITANIG